MIGYYRPIIGNYDAFSRRHRFNVGLMILLPIIIGNMTAKWEDSPIGVALSDRMKFLSCEQ